MPSVRAGSSCAWSSCTGLPYSAGQGAVLVLVVLMVLGPAPGKAGCEDRCGAMVPRLAALRRFWNSSFKRVGERRISFEEFILSLVQASRSNGRSQAQLLSGTLLNLIGQYQGCVRACEHPYSKRGADNLARQRSLSNAWSCDERLLDKSASPLLTRLCMTYGP